MITILADALTSPARLVERFGAANMPTDQIRKLLSRGARMAAALGGSPGERTKLVRELVEKIIIDEKTITIKLRRGLLLGGDVASSAPEAASDSAVELTAAVAFTRRGAETKLVLPGLAPQKHSPRWQGRQPVALTATRLTELDLPLDWTEQHKLLAS